MNGRFHYVGSYGHSYSRHRIIQKGLRELGYSVTESRDQSFLPLRWIRLCVAISRVPRTVPLIVGEASNYLAPVLAFARLQRRKVTFDSFVSLREIHADYQTGFPGRIWSAFGGFLDRINCRLATTVIVDTEANRRYYIEVLGVSPRKLHVVYVGAETDLFAERWTPKDEATPRPLSILFYGSFLPLHGIETILGAAALLQRTHPQYRFTIVGAGRELARMLDVASSLSLSNVSFGPDHVPYEHLPDLISASDTCLGVFGATDQAQRVVPNKVFQAASCGRPVITADTPGIREVFSRESVLLVPPANPEALAAAIRQLGASQDLRRALSRRASSLVRTSYGNVSIAKQMLASQRER